MSKHPSPSRSRHDDIRVVSEPSLPSNLNQTFANVQTLRPTDELDFLRHLAQDFASLLDRTDISDCLLCVQGTYMAVHRCVLVARSKTFSDVISTHINELETSRASSANNEKFIINIDKTHPDIMKELVVFLYTGQCDLNQENAIDLLCAAGRYDVKSLKVYVVEFLIRHIDHNNILTLLRAAYRYDNIVLKNNCINYFLKYSKQIINIHQLWKEFADENPTIVNELLYWVVHPQEFSIEPTSNQFSSEW